MIAKDYEAPIQEALAGIRVRCAETGKFGAAGQADIIANGAGYDTLGGEYRVCSTDFKGRRNPTRTYTNLAAALTAFNALNAGGKSLWHVSVAGKRRRAIG